MTSSFFIFQRIFGNLENMIIKGIYAFMTPCFTFALITILTTASSLNYESKKSYKLLNRLLLFSNKRELPFNIKLKVFN